MGSYVRSVLPSMKKYSDGSILYAYVCEKYASDMGCFIISIFSNPCVIQSFHYFKQCVAITLLFKVHIDAV